MANNPKSSLSSLILLLLSLLSYSVAISRDNICKLTRFPSYCNTMLPNEDANIRLFGQYSIRTSSAQSHKFLNMVHNHLQVDSDNLLEPPAVRALEDCHELASLSVDLLESCIGTVNGTTQPLPVSQANDVHTWLSGVVTNLQTCLEGLESAPSAEAVKNDMSQTINDDTKLHSVSLALFTRGWVSNETVTVPLVSVLKVPVLPRVGDEIIKVSDFVVVSKDGSWDFTTINDAVAAVPDSAGACDGYFLIYVTAGVYEEYVSIASSKRHVFLLGDGINRTIITGNRSFVDGWTTFHSATLAVTGKGFLAVNITVRNTAGPSKHQAVAVRNSADLSTFYSCSFEAYQDTLYAHSLRQFYRDCDIYGTVDFIFGNGSAVVQNCNIYPRLPLPGQFNAITSHGRTDPNQNTGISIHNCNIAPTADLADANAAAAASGNGTFTKTYLGRPWKEYSRIVFMQSYMDEFIDPVGWREWNETDFALNTLYFAEFDNWGPGSDTTNRVNWTGYHVIDAVEAANFTVSRFLFGDFWLPQTGVPYIGGLLL